MNTNNGKAETITHKVDKVFIPHEKIHNEKCELFKYLKNFLVESAPIDQIEEEIKRAFYRIY